MKPRRWKQKNVPRKLWSNRNAEMDYATAEAELAQAVAQLHAIARMKKTTH
jgi:hypothetical protein